jgi:hypothetical protein
MMIRRLFARSPLLAWLLAAVLLLAGCAQLTTRDGAIKQMLVSGGPNWPLLTYTSILDQPWQDKTIVLFRATRRIEPHVRPVEEFGYALMSRGAQGWQVERSSSHGESPERGRVSHEVHYLDDLDLTIMYGRALAVGAATVEITYSEGDTQSLPIENVSFLDVRAGRHGVEKIVIYNQLGDVLP